MRVLAASLRLAVEGASALYGYELFARLREWEGASPMNHGTLYRCLRALERRGYFTTRVVPQTDSLARVCYTLTPAGLEAARESTVALAAAGTPAWVDPGHALPSALTGRPEPRP